MSDLTRMANLAGTDKGTVTGAAHGYTLIYEMLLGHMRRQPGIDLLEMGLAIGGPELGGDVDRLVTGSPSVDLWLGYFDDARMVGFDISDFSAIRHDRFRFFRGDSGKAADLEQLVALDRRFDVILDDASHASFHQQLGLATLFKLLKPGGFYIIEDLDWQPEAYESSLPNVCTTAKLLVEFLRTGEFRQSAAIDAAAAEELRRLVSSVMLFDESTLNANADNFNRRFGSDRARRTGWRAKSGFARWISPYFWLFNARRLYQSMSGEEFATHQTVKLAILQRINA